MNKRRILLIGGGGHCKSVIDVIEEQNVYLDIGIVDSPDKKGTLLLNYPVVGSDMELESLFNNGFKEAFITLGSIGNYNRRVELYKTIKEIGFTIPNIISNTSLISKHVSMGEGNFIGKGTIVNVSSKLGNNIIINTGSVIEHDCNIFDYVHIAPGSVLSGGVSIGTGTHVGTNSTIIQNVNVGRDTLLGAGSVVVGHIGDSVTAFGVPCKEMIDK